MSDARAAGATDQGPLREGSMLILVQVPVDLSTVTRRYHPFVEPMPSIRVNSRQTRLGGFPIAERSKSDGWNSSQPYRESHAVPTPPHTLGGYRH